LYFGPYTSVVMVKTLLDLARQLFPLRNCKLNLSQDNIKAGKFKVCLEYHLGNCKAPCIGLQNEKDYDEAVDQVKRILGGSIKQVSLYLKGLMRKYAEEFKYEDAQILKEKLVALEKYKSKSTIVNPKIKNVDVFSMVEEKDYAFVNYLKVIDGAIIQAHTVELKKRMDEEKQKLLEFAIIDIRQKTKSNAKEIIVPFKMNVPLENIRFVVPQRGDKRQLLDLSERNAKHYKIERNKRLEISTKPSGPDRILERLKKDLHLKLLPKHIECFDNSNVQGTNPVAACVVFRNAKPSKKEYRHYHINTVQGPDDFASMEEVIFRRYSRLLREKKQLPQLIIIDGGKGQLNASVKSLDKLGLRGRMAIIGVAKKLEEIYFPGDKFPLYIDKNSESLKLIQNLRNEAHRFGITFHRKQRSKAMTSSELDGIKGIGEKTRELLLSKLGSVDAIKSADIESLTVLVGKSKAQILKNYFLRSIT